MQCIIISSHVTVGRNGTAWVEKVPYITVIGGEPDKILQYCMNEKKGHVLTDRDIQFRLGIGLYDPNGRTRLKRGSPVVRNYGVCGIEKHFDRASMRRMPEWRKADMGMEQRRTDMKAIRAAGVLKAYLLLGGLPGSILLYWGVYSYVFESGDFFQLKNGKKIGYETEYFTRRETDEFFQYIFDETGLECQWY